MRRIKMTVSSPLTSWSLDIVRREPQVDVQMEMNQQVKAKRKELETFKKNIESLK